MIDSYQGSAKDVNHIMPKIMQENISENRSLSSLLEDSKALLSGEETTLKQVFSLFQDRGTAFILFLVALPAALPVPAIGIFMIIGPPLIFLTFQQMIGRKVIWLPKWLSQKSLKTASFIDVINKAIPIIQKIEIFSKPRLELFTKGIAPVFIGLMGFIMALSVLVPVPLTNTVPSMGIAGMALGILMRDGLAVIVGAIIGLAWVAMLVILFLYFGAETVDIVKGFFKSLI